jgi:hypothetical protein
MLALLAGIEGGGREVTLEVKLATNQLPIILFVSFHFGCLLAPGSGESRCRRWSTKSYNFEGDVIEFRGSLQFYGIFRTPSDHD